MSNDSFTLAAYSLTLCGRIIEKVYCDNLSLVRLACCSFELYQNKFNMSFLPYSLRVVLSLYFLIVGPAINPVIYGARTEKISSAIKKTIFWLKNDF
ncbi:olfactory receptor 52A5-like [Osmerus eperlanus]|uniref:olfactory receptor 52A5-like n=1 Tax=Osmerus eperlanus TaxID=29151 RepID=UPI002E11835B